MPPRASGFRFTSLDCNDPFRRKPRGAARNELVDER
jgi:hypothetical protein